MPLIPQFGCDLPEPPTDCEWLFDIGEKIRQGAMDGLTPYLPAEGTPCAGFESYVSLGEPPADACDILGVWLMGYGPSTRAARRMADQPGYSTPDYQSEWSVNLWEQCYPGPTEAGGVVELPDLELLHEVNRWVYQHGMAMYHGVLDAFKGDICSTVVPSSMRALMPQGGCGGWQFSVIVSA